MTSRAIYILGFLGVTAILSASLYFQFHDGINPCPLCVLQRICFSLLGLLFLCGIMLNRYRIARIILNIFTLVTAILGGTLAGRQIWLQHQPNMNTECGVSLQYMLQVLPIDQVFKKVFTGSAECSQQGWLFLSLNMAEWALICFTSFALFSIYLLKKR